MRRRTVGGFAAAVLVLVVGCTGGGGSADDGVADGSAVEDGAADDGLDGEVAGAVDEPAVPSGRLQLVGWEQHHTLGVSVALRAVEVDATGNVLLDLEAVNSRASGLPARLATQGAGVLVLDDLGQRYPLVRVDGNGDLLFRGDQRMTGTLAFEGPIDPEARRLTVAFNQREGETLIDAEADGPGAIATKFLFEEVPLPGVGLESEAVRGGEGTLLDRVRVEVDQVHEVDGVEITVVGYEFDGRTVEMELEVVNGSGRVLQLAQGDPRLRDERGSRLLFQRDWSAPRDERVVRLEPGEEASVRFGWRGGLDPTSEELKLVFALSARIGTLEGIPGPAAG